MSSSLLFPLLLALATPAADAPRDPPAPAAATVAIDPATGRLRAPTTDESEALALDASRLRQDRALQRSAKSAPARPANEAQALLTEQRHDNGMVMMQVPESLDSQLSVRRDADGRLVMGHGATAEASHEHE